MSCYEHQVFGTGIFVTSGSMFHQINEKRNGLIDGAEQL